MTAYPRIARFLATTAAGGAILVSTVGRHLRSLTRCASTPS